MEEAPPGAGRKWNVTNLDGSFHKHVKYGGATATAITTSHEQQQQQQQQKMTGDKPTTITNNVQKAEGYQERQTAIQTAHDENMKSAEAHTQAIKDQTQAIKDQTDAISDVKFELHEMNTNMKTVALVITTYLETIKK